MGIEIPLLEVAAEPGYEDYGIDARYYLVPVIKWDGHTVWEGEKVRYEYDGETAERKAKDIAENHLITRLKALFDEQEDDGG